MENLFNKKPSAARPKQSSLLAKDVFKKVDSGNPLAGAPEEIK